MRRLLAYRRLPSPLHAARATAGALWICALIFASILLYHPLALAAIALVALIGGAACGAGRPLLRALRLCAWLAIPTIVVNVLVWRQGLTVFWRLGDLGPFGQGNLTVEALVYGAVIALKLTDVILLCALATVAIDPDELLAICMRLSFRWALTASLALRMAPLLAADAERLAEAQRTRPSPPGGVRGRALLISATVGGSLDRSLDVAATLELRGIASAKRMRTLHRPRSRHDIAFACSGCALAALALGGRLSGALRFDAYPLLRLGDSPLTIVFFLALIVVPLLPFLDRRGVAR